MRRIHEVFQELLLVISCLAATGISVSGSASKQAIIEIQVSCTAKESEESFVYELQTDDSPFQEPEQISLQLADGQKGKFRIRYTYPGTYHCSISQKTGDSQGMEYDHRVYQAMIYVTEDQKGNLFAEAILYPDQSKEKSSSCDFLNKMETSNAPTPIPLVPDTPNERRVQTGDPLDPEFWLIIGTLALMIAVFAGNEKKRSVV